MADPTPYRVDGEVGRFTFQCHRVLCQGSVILDSSREVFPALTGRELYQTIGYKEVAITTGCLEGSYRKTAARLDRTRHQPNSAPVSTLRDLAESEGTAASLALEQEAKRVLHGADLSPETLLPSCVVAPCVPRLLATEVVESTLQAIAKGDSRLLEAMRANPVRYEDPAHCVNVSIDDVLAKKQKEHRTAEGGAAEPSREPSEDDDAKRVHCTVAQIAVAGTQRIFVSASPLATCRQVTAFLVANGLLRSTLTFFVDGYRPLQDLLLRVFGWHAAMTWLLDWHHLDKKCQEQLSRAMNDRHARNEVLERLKYPLWHGCVDDAIAVVRAIAPGKIKSGKELDRLVGYFERHRPHIPCYAARKKLGLQNSSNRGEKANDLVVASRQKHNGMSWSQPGSGALATLQALVCNDNERAWFESRKVDFRLAA